MPIDREKLIVKLEADSSRLQTELDKSQKKLKRYEKTAKRTKKSVSGLFSGMAGKLALPALATGFGALIKSQISYIDNLQKLEDRLGISTEALSQLKYVAERSGVSFQTMTMGLQRMTRRVAEAANGTGEAKNALKELGLSAKQLKQLAPDEQFKALAEALSQVDNQADKVRLAMKLFDAEGVALLQTMTKGKKGITAMMGEADKLGLTIGDKLGKDAARLNDSLTNMSAHFDVLKTKVLTDMIPAFDRFGHNLQKISGWYDKFFGEKTAADKKAEEIAEIEAQLHRLQGVYERMSDPGARARTAKKIEKLLDKHHKIMMDVEVKATVNKEAVKADIADAIKEVGPAVVDVVAKYKRAPGVYSDGSTIPDLLKAAIKKGTK